MRRLPFLALALTLGAPAHAQMLQANVNDVRHSGAAYSGPGDVVTTGWFGWWGLRGFSAAYAAPGTNKSINIIRISDSATTDIVILSSGALDTATAATFCASTTCYVVTAYDQTGNGRDLSGSNGVQLVFNCLSTLPCLRSTSGSSSLSRAATTLPNVPITYSFVYNPTSGSSLSYFLSTSGATGPTEYVHLHGANQLSPGGTSAVDITVSDGAWHAVQSVIDATTAAANVDGTVTSGSATTPNAGSALFGWFGATGNASFQGSSTEAGVNSSALSSGAQTSLCHNQYAYWGTATSC